MIREAGDAEFAKAGTVGILITERFEKKVAREALPLVGRAVGAIGRGGRDDGVIEVTDASAVMFDGLGDCADAVDVVSDLLFRSLSAVEQAGKDTHHGCV